MNTFKIDKLIVKLIGNTISEEESEVLANWLSIEENLHYFNEFIELNQLINNKQEFNYNKSFQKIIKRSQSPKNRKRPLYFYAIAASVTLLIALTFTYNRTSNLKEATHKTTIVSNNIKPGTDKAILTLENGKQVVLEEGQNYSNSNMSSNGEHLVYDGKENSNKEITYNILTIPRGGQFNITLADGTQIWLNSETKIKYPVAFEIGKTRAVELIYGEAYFDVTSSSKNKGSKFIVSNKNQEVEVLGTAFNIRNYKEDSNVITTLVHGKVSINYDGKNQILLPNQQSNLNILSNSLHVKKVDVFYETSWRTGSFSFENKSLKEIMTVLSRWYDFEVVFKNSAVAKEEFVGVIGKNEKIESILKTIKNFGIIKNYKIEDKTITIE